MLWIKLFVVRIALLLGTRMSYVDHKFIKLVSPKLDRFQKKNNNLYNFRCPFCGDSEKNTYKARGYVYELKDSLIFKCHNCSVGCSLGNLLKHVDLSLYNSYVLERFKGNRTFENKKKEEVSYKFEAPKFHSVDPLTKIGAVKLSKCDVEHPAIKFTKSRKIPSDHYGYMYYLNDEEKLEELSDKYKDRIAGHSARILFPYYNEHSELIGLTGRAIDPKNKLRYLTLKLSDHPMIYGLDRVNKNRKIYVVEGPIDSLFLKNGIAVSGADFAKLDSVAPKDKCVLVFDNEPRNKEVLSQQLKMIEAGYSVCIWPDNIYEKDINDMVLRGWKYVADIIDSNTHKGISAVAAFHNWKRI